jgi:hypothetical protein
LGERGERARRREEWGERRGERREKANKIRRKHEHTSEEVGSKW